MPLNSPFATGTDLPAKDFRETRFEGRTIDFIQNLRDFAPLFVEKKRNNMPELPEVNTFQHYFDETALNQKIVDTEVHDDKIMRNGTGADFADFTRGRTFLRTYRRGKYLFAEMDNGQHVLLHFGMTGDLAYYDAEEDRPKYERFRFVFDNGMKLGFDCPRKFARILTIPDRDAYITDIELGEDAQRIPLDDFLDMVKGKKSTIKGFLLNQKYIAGMGNLYADEVCYRTDIHPASRTDKLSAAQLTEIWQAMQDILAEAVEKLPHYKAYPGVWFWQKWRHEGEVEGVGTVRSGKYAGRTTYWVEGRQRLYE